TKRERNSHFKSIAALSGRFSGGRCFRSYRPPLTRRSLTRPFPSAVSCGRNGRSDVLSGEFGGLPHEKTDLSQRPPDRHHGPAADRNRGRRGHVRPPAGG